MRDRVCRLPRVAFVLLRGLDHFARELVAALAGSGRMEARAFYIDPRSRDLGPALAWADAAADTIWFEFCWPPFPEMMAAAEFGERRVVVRVHRIEAYGTEHATRAPWHKVDDVIVVGADMARRLDAAAPGLRATTRLRVVHNGIDLGRYMPATAADPFRIGWCGRVSLHKNPNLALEVLHRLRGIDRRYELHVAAQGGEPVAIDSFVHLGRRMGLEPAVHIVQDIPQHAMPAWHACNGALLSTSVYESFGYAIAEAAAVGCDLAVLDNTAAAEFWPAAMRFGAVDEAVEIIRNARPHRWRAHVAERFGLERQVGAVCDLLLARVRRKPTGETVVALSHGGWRGQFIVRDGQDHIQRVIAGTGGFYEAEMLEDLRERLAPGGLFVDVGANIGNHALFAAAVCGARVLAFEPSPKLAEHCAANLDANGVGERATVFRLGVGSCKGRARLRPGPAGNAGMTRLEAGQGEVEVVRLDDVLEGMSPAAIKVDVEGMEAAVLLGAQETILRTRPVLYVETATAEELAAVQAVLSPLGYEAVARFNAMPTWRFECIGGKLDAAAEKVMEVA